MKKKKKNKNKPRCASASARRENCCAKEQANRGEDVRKNDPDASRHQYSGADESENEKLGVVQRRSGRVNDACGT